MKTAAFPSTLYSTRHPALAGVSLIALLVLAALAAKLYLSSGIVWRCPSIVLLELPCPSCGSTRAFASLAELNVLQALRFNPMVVLGSLLIPIVALSSALRNRLERFAALGWSVFGIAVVLNWLYLVFFLPR